MCRLIVRVLRTRFYIALKKYEKHPSVIRIKDKHTVINPFLFQYISRQDMRKEIKNMNASKAIPKDTLPVKIVQNNSDIMTDILCNNFNNSIYSSEFPNNLKLADVSPIYKDGERVIKTNYRPKSILPAISKLYEKPLFRQIYEYFSPKLSFNVGFVQVIVPNTVCSYC